MWLPGRYLAVQAAVRRCRRWRNTERAPVLLRVHGDFDEAAFHHTTFREFLRRIGSEVDTLDELDLWPAVRAFNSILTTACVMDELEVGVACMGIIERAFAGVSATIGRVVVERRWITRERLVHYALHAAIDTRHAEEFFAVVEEPYAEEGRRYFVDQGLQLGAYALDRLYRDLHLAPTTN